MKKIHLESIIREFGLIFSDEVEAVPSPSDRAAASMLGGGALIQIIHVSSEDGGMYRKMVAGAQGGDRTVRLGATDIDTDEFGGALIEQAVLEHRFESKWCWDAHLIIDIRGNLFYLQVRGLTKPPARSAFRRIMQVAGAA